MLIFVCFVGLHNIVFPNHSQNRFFLFYLFRFFMENRIQCQNEPTLKYQRKTNMYNFSLISSTLIQFVKYMYFNIENTTNPKRTRSEFSRTKRLKRRLKARRASPATRSTEAFSSGIVGGLGAAPARRSPTRRHQERTLLLRTRNTQPHFALHKQCTRARLCARARTCACARAQFPAVIGRHMVGKVTVLSSLD